MTRWSLPGWHDGMEFRSRTEARWAKFFDELGLKWEYEAQGFDVDGTWYLPDFVVFAATGMLWAEVKPGWDVDPDGEAKFRKFAPQRPQPSRAVLLAGPPAIDGQFLVVGGDDSLDDPLKGTWEDDTQQWRPCPSGHHFDLAYPGTFKARYPEDGCDYVPGNPGVEKLAKAVLRALSARFEHKSPPDGPGGVGRA